MQTVAQSIQDKANSSEKVIDTRIISNALCQALEGSGFEALKNIIQFRTRSQIDSGTQEVGDSFLCFPPSVDEFPGLRNRLPDALVRVNAAVKYSADLAIRGYNLEFKYNVQTRIPSIDRWSQS